MLMIKGLQLEILSDIKEKSQMWTDYRIYEHIMFHLI